MLKDAAISSALVALLIGLLFAFGWVVYEERELDSSLFWLVLWIVITASMAITRFTPAERERRKVEAERSSIWRKIDRMRRLAEHKGFGKKAHVVTRWLGAQGRYEDHAIAVETSYSRVRILTRIAMEESVVFEAQRETITKKELSYIESRPCLKRVDDETLVVSTYWDKGPEVEKTVADYIVIDSYIPGSWEDQFNIVYSHAWQTQQAKADKDQFRNEKKREFEQREQDRRGRDALEAAKRRFGL